MNEQIAIPGRKIRHSYRCARRSPLVTAHRVLENGRVITFHKCTACAGSDVDSVLIDTMLPDGPDAA